MISVANADVSERGRSRWWDRPPSRYSRHLGAAINPRTSHKSRFLGARTSNRSRGAAAMISVANADVSARGRSRWWDKPPCHYTRLFGAALNPRTFHRSQGDQNQQEIEWYGDPLHHFLERIHDGNS